MIPLIVNIPHAGLEIPGDIPFLLDGDELCSVIRHMADLYTDEWIEDSETIPSGCNKNITHCGRHGAICR